MILVKEITNDWVDVSRVPNHTYLMDDKMDKVLGTSSGIIRKTLLC